MACNSRTRYCVGPLQIIAVVAFLGAGVGSPQLAQAEGGAEKPVCIWEKDLVLDIEGHEITLSQENVKSGKPLENGGYFVRSDPRGLFLFVRTPEGILYRTGLTVLEQGKGRDKCQVFYAGRMIAAAAGSHF